MERREVFPVVVTIKEKKNNITRICVDNNWEILIGEGFGGEEMVHEINWQRYFIESFMQSDYPKAQITSTINYERIKEEYDY
jgi:hypothetical protein